MSKFNLTTYLMLSVVIILSGIAWVIFTQMDSRLYDSAEFIHLHSEQDELLQQYYQLQKKYLPGHENTPQSAPPVTLETPLQQPVESLNLTTAPPPSSDALAAHDHVWSNPISSEIEPSEFMHNNPWSPNYQPGY